ncbi:MAG TPA: hypothetical protein VGH39_02095 [Xanthobacteraceae bacterium]
MRRSASPRGDDPLALHSNERIILVREIERIEPARTQIEPCQAYGAVLLIAADEPVE